MSWDKPNIRAKDGEVVWKLNADDARELAAFIEAHIRDEDMAHHDVLALRRAAYLIDGCEDPDGD